VSLGVTDAVTIGTSSITRMADPRDIGIGIVIVVRARRNSKTHARKCVLSRHRHHLQLGGSVSLGVTDAVTIGTSSITTMAGQHDIGIGIVIVVRARRNSKTHAKKCV